jgi:hypothetical protein
MSSARSKLLPVDKHKHISHSTHQEQQQFLHSFTQTSLVKPWRPTEAQDQAQEEKNQQSISGGEGQEAARSKSRR